MPEEDIILKQLALQRAFSPGAPVPKREYLAGREAELREVLRAVAQQGMHAVLFGERGVGKTSVARFVHEIWTGVAKSFSEVIPVHVNCDSGDTFRSIWLKVSEEIYLALDRRLVEPDNVPGSRAFKSALDDLQVGQATPHVIRRALELTDHTFIIVIDEFDALRDPDGPRLFADTIKLLSDQLVDATLILVGVADTLEDLIEEHQSIDRSLVQVLIPRMERAELQKVVITGLTQVAMSIEPDALRKIVLLSRGLPHYTHLLAVHSGLVSIAAGRDVLTVDDFSQGLIGAVSDMQETLGRDYHEATASPHKDARYKQVLGACAVAESDDLGYFAPSDIRQPLSDIVGTPLKIDSFMRHLRQFCSQKRGETLQDSGEHTRPRYRFRNPLMQPYVLLRALVDGSMPDSLIHKVLGDPTS